jgi:crotonobetainyl-CoA:carnitine CoA-transferase CaiB-like acyl-CoA transferase
MMSLTGTPDGPPTKVGTPVGDLTAGMFTAHAILASLLERNRTGCGRVIDVSLNDSLLALHTYQAGRFFATGVPPGREGNFHATIVPYGMYATADGHINIGVGSDDQFRRFCEALEAPELDGDDRFRTNAQRQRSRAHLNAELEGRLRTRPSADWLERFERAGIPAGPIYDLKQAFDSPLAAERQMRVTVDRPGLGPIQQVGVPWKLDGASSPVRRPPPRLGEHTTEVLREVLGASDEEVAAITGQPVRGEAPPPPRRPRP